jgi:hypothetical protein
MKTTVNSSEFHNAFNTIRPENFSHEALSALFEHLEDLERDTGEEYELDVIELCCDFNEATYTEVADNYSIDLTEGETEDEKIALVVEFLENEGALVANLSDSMLYRQF